MASNKNRHSRAAAKRGDPQASPDFVTLHPKRMRSRKDPNINTAEEENSAFIDARAFNVTQICLACT